MTTSKESERSPSVTLARASPALKASVSFRAGLLSANARACATPNSSSTLRMFNGFSTRNRTLKQALCRGNAESGKVICDQWSPAVDERDEERAIIGLLHVIIEPGHL